MWSRVLSERPLIAILRGVKPDEAGEIANALCDAGFLCFEVPLNSPSPFDSIARMREAVAGRAMVGAGTVLSAEAVRRAADAGAEIIISPNMNRDVIGATKRAGLVSAPAFLSPTEAFEALDAGADALKLFPAEIARPEGLKAVRAVLPPSTPVFAVGGVTAGDVKTWRGAGASGFGLGGAVYKPGMSAREVEANARAFVAAWNAAGA